MFKKPAMQMDQVEIFLDKFVNWASSQPDIRGVALVGSYARNAATESSDVDLVILATDPQSYLQDQTWVRQFGEPTRLQTEVYGSLTSIRAWYPDGGEIEYGITDETWAAVPLDEGTRQVITSGMRVLFEREPILSRHLLKP
jgi:predicted nucleotidyltransferase